MELSSGGQDILNIVITGTSSGLGFELAKRFASGSNTVVGFSRSESRLPTSQYYRHFQVDIADRETVLRAANDCGLETLDLISFWVAFD